ncbi:hypothetical protein TH63_19470 [Rufibacter radiotolerans]|uniref:Uncharacterized protein n=1 Tax=Rufibacter radiotolerans TaxID=1379910 RepID=A0A0H4WA27_9BACT|nr:hypothetical protein TH63_19470 [Rufibacter radiotolerans]
MNKEKGKFNWAAIGWLTFSTLWILEGIIFIIKDKAIIGLHRDSSLNIVGGWLIVLVGLAFLYVAFHSLSPFGSVRSFMRGISENKKKRSHKSG